MFTVPNKEKDYQAYMVFILVVIWLCAIVSIVSLGFIFFPEIWFRWLGILCSSAFISIFCLKLNQSGHTRLASWLFIVMLWLLITLPCYSAGGIMSLGILSQMSVILTAGFLLGWQGGMVVGLISLATDFGFAYLEINGDLPAPTVLHTPITRWIGSIIPFGTILALQYYSTNDLRRSLIKVQEEVLRREEAEKKLIQTVDHLKERVKELKTLFKLSRILQDENSNVKNLVMQIAEILPAGWQYPEITAAKVSIGEITYQTNNYQSSIYNQRTDMKTNHGTPFSIEIVYLEQTPEFDEGPFLKEERHLINVITEMIKMNLEWRERRAELNDYKYAIDVGSIVAIADADGKLTFVNDNFCKISKYNSQELVGHHYNIITSEYHPPQFFSELADSMKNGKTFRGEFCNKAKDNSLYWVDTIIVPFLDENGKVYQYLSINHDITERKNADEKIRQSEKLLKKITSQVPGNTYMFEIDENGKTKIHFSSHGTDTITHGYEIDELFEITEKLGEILHPEDKERFNFTMKQAYSTETTLSFQFRIIVNGQIRWRWIQAVPEKNSSGTTLWYGVTSDVTQIVDYIASIEQMIFDIGHVIRRPVSSMMGMSKLIIDTELKENEIKEVSEKLLIISEEMDKFIKELNDAYSQKRKEAKLNIDTSSLINKRTSLFN